MNTNKKIIIGAAGLIAAGTGAYLYVRKKLAARKANKHIVAHDPQSLIRNVMHKSKEVQIS